MGSLLGAPAGLPPACRTGKTVAAGSVVWRGGGVRGKVVLKEPEPEETVDPQLKIEGPERPEQ